MGVVPIQSNTNQGAGTKAPPAPVCTIVIFGAGGDLTRRLVVPALYNLRVAGQLPDAFRIVGVDLAQKTLDEWKGSLLEMLLSSAGVADSELGAGKIDKDAWGWITDRMSYMQGDLTDPGCYEQLGNLLDEIEKETGADGNRLYYLAVADRFFGTIVDHLGESGLARQDDRAWRRVIIEKPFGHDLESARALNAQVLRSLDESQIYRIDHFLGKETVQNILVLRFGNGMFEPLWNRNHIEYVEITVAETLGVEHRGKFYERTGALRDMVPNHVFQLLSLIAMEPPSCFEANAFRSAKSSLLQAVRPPTPGQISCEVVRGQYTAGEIRAKPVIAYRDEPNVASDSNIETYIAFRLMIDNWRWAGVPFYLRTGKRLADHKTEIAIRFRQAPLSLFRDTPVSELTPNWLMLRIQPNEGVSFEFGAKHPGPCIEIGGVRMDFNYKDYFKMAPNTGYETLLYDCMNGDATLFQRADNVDFAWQVVQPVLDAWAKSREDSPHLYAAGSAGPIEAEQLMARDGNAWRPVVAHPGTAT